MPTHIVRDSSGGVIPGARVMALTATGIDEQTVTGPDGRFTLTKGLGAEVTLIFRAGGFRGR